MMQSQSQNFPRTFSRLVSHWDPKVGRRSISTSTNPAQNASWTGLWSDASSKYSYDYVPKIMEPFFASPSSVEELRGIVANLDWATVNSAGQAWVYNPRKTDTIPRSNQDEERLYSFTRAIINTDRFQKTDRKYLLDNIHVSVCFVLWCLTKPNFFYIDKVHKQTTRRGIERVWTPFLMMKEPVKASPPQQKAVFIRQYKRTTDAQLPKLLQEQTRIRGEIEKNVNGTLIEWDDKLATHITISEAIANQEQTLSIKQTKKVQSLYNDYTKISDKIRKMQDKIDKANASNAKIAISWPPSLGPPPPPSPVLTREPATIDGVVVESLRIVGVESVGATGACSGCAESQPNQLAHMGAGGCLASESEEEEVPESWEDL
jgi:hypothetical protein